MSRFFGMAIALAVILNSIVYSDICNHDPFPPFPPSPPEFQTPVAVQQQGSAAVLSWVPVSSDGYSVLICEAGQFIPVAHEVQNTNLVLADFNAVGQQEFLVMAYVRVANNLVYNSGAVGSFNFVDVTDKSQVGFTEVDVALAPKEDTHEVSMQDRSAVLSALPKFNGSHSFYSAKYPEVKNPFHSTTLATGEIVPALLLDQDIDETVERIMVKSGAKPQQVSNASNPGVKPVVTMSEVGIPQVANAGSSNVEVASQPNQQGPAVDSQKSQQSDLLTQSTDTTDTTDPSNKKENNSSNVMIIIVVVILIIFFQLFKEGK